MTISLHWWIVAEVEIVNASVPFEKCERCSFWTISMIGGQVNLAGRVELNPTQPPLPLDPDLVQSRGIGRERAATPCPLHISIRCRQTFTGWHQVDGNFIYKAIEGKDVVSIGVVDDCDTAVADDVIDDDPLSQHR